MSINNFDNPELWKPMNVKEGLSESKLKKSFEKEVESFGNKVFFGSKDYVSNHTRFSFRNWFVHVDNSVLEEFYKEFKYYISGELLNYNNLINLLIMVKDAGDDFRNILTQNLPYIDRWTILDTGSTDNTVEIIKDVLKHKKGMLYEEPFINFRESRNRLLDLAGDVCAFNVMLDDTYVIEGDLRAFLEFARGDDVIDSYSITIDNGETRYNSNRITKPERGLRYKYIIHEIIQTENNLNAAIPHNIARLKDINSNYMLNRTIERKQKDIEWLEKTLEEYPDDPRTLYYLAETYLCIEDWEKALYWYKERVKNPGGYSGEIQDSLYYIAVISHFKLNKEWSECLPLFLNCYNYDTSRGDSIYFVGSYYSSIGDKEQAYKYIRTAFDSGIPEITISVRKLIYNYHIPNDLIPLCYERGEYQLALDCCMRILENDNSEPTTIVKWFKILTHILNSPPKQEKARVTPEKLIVFVSDGGWDKWNGETLYTKGLGGSETFSIKYSETLVKMGYKVMVFCNCDEEKVYNGVRYHPIKNYINFIAAVHVDYCIINRYPEYIPVTIYNDVQNVYYVMHDLVSSGEIIPVSKNLKGIFCISEWHKKQFLNFFPVFENITHIVSYGIDIDLFPETKKEEYSFIYPSFPNRGLLPLLQMFPRIVEKYPKAKLHVFCDTKNKWVQKHWKETIDQVEVLLEEQKDHVINHGWVNFFELREYWKRAQVWFYPCTFMETCCLTAYEAAASKCLIVSNNLAALEESIGDRALIVHGDASKPEWHEEALKKLFDVLDGVVEYDHIQRNYEWVKTKQYEKVVSDFVKYLD